MHPWIVVKLKVVRGAEAQRTYEEMRTAIQEFEVPAELYIGDEKRVKFGHCRVAEHSVQFFEGDDDDPILTIPAAKIIFNKGTDELPRRDGGTSTVAYSLNETVSWFPYTATPVYEYGPRRPIVAFLAVIDDHEDPPRPAAHESAERGAAAEALVAAAAGGSKGQRGGRK